PDMHDLRLSADADGAHAVRIRIHARYSRALLSPFMPGLIDHHATAYARAPLRLSGPDQCPDRRAIPPAYATVPGPGSLPGRRPCTGRQARPALGRRILWIPRPLARTRPVDARPPCTGAHRLIATASRPGQPVLMRTLGLVHRIEMNGDVES